MRDTDTYGRPIAQAYRILDHAFEQRLKAFDPELRLMFDQGKKRWVILQPKGSFWDVLIVAEDKDGNELPLGEWVFNKLFVYRHNAEVKHSMSPDRYLDHLIYQARQNFDAELKNISDDNQALLREDRNVWRRGARELDNLPTSDVTAGYRKI